MMLIATACVARKYRGDAAHAEIVDLEEFLDAVFRAFAADSWPRHRSRGRGGDGSEGLLAGR
jgi:hypothetical protein